MMFVHRVSLRMTPKQRDLIESFGIIVQRVPLPDGELSTFKVREDHPDWDALSALFRAWNALDAVDTVFTEMEMRSARWLEMIAWHHGYPQPEDEFGYLQVTYDLSDYCRRCGLGARQKAPFRMKREPRWGRRGIMQLVWVYGEIFVKPEVWRHVFQPAGVACRPVTDPGGRALKSVVQLVVESTVRIVTDGLASKRCEQCGRSKLLPFTRGAFPALLEEPGTAIARTAEYFGDGAQADQPVLISQALAQALANADVRGASLRPVAEPTGDAQESSVMAIDN